MTTRSKTKPQTVKLSLHVFDLLNLDNLTDQLSPGFISYCLKENN